MMPNVRDLGKKYGINKFRYRELYYFCLQYQSWIDELNYKTSTVKSVEITDMPLTHSNSSATERLAIRRSELQSKCELIEQTAIETDSKLYRYIIKAVTEEHVGFNYLVTVMDMPCSRNTFYERRRRFYYLLDKKI